MDSRKLLQIDASLECVTEGKSLLFSRLSDPRWVQEDALFFIKDKKFLGSLGENFNGQRIHLIVPQSFYHDFKDEIASMATSIFLTPNLDLTISLVSKGFYDEMFEKIDFSVDGREKGSVTVPPSTVISPHAFLGEGVCVGNNCTIHSHVTLMANVRIGDNVEVLPGVVIYPNVVVGNNVRIHAGCILGGDGFGYNFVGGVHRKVWHMGAVVVGDNVEIGAGTCIDAGTFNPTLIGEGTKIDNQVQIGHNCEIGKGVILCGHTGIGGSSRIGDFSVLGGKVGMSHGLTLGKRCKVAGASQLANDWPDDSIIGGYPARPMKEWMRGVAYLKKKSLRASS